LKLKKISHKQGKLQWLVDMSGFHSKH